MEELTNSILWVPKVSGSTTRWQRQLYRSSIRKSSASSVFMSPFSRVSLRKFQQMLQAVVAALAFPPSQLPQTQKRSLEEMLAYSRPSFLKPTSKGWYGRPFPVWMSQSSWKFLANLTKVPSQRIDLSKEWVTPPSIQMQQSLWKGSTREASATNLSLLMTTGLYILSPYWGRMEYCCHLSQSSLALSMTAPIFGVYQYCWMSLRSFSMKRMLSLCLRWSSTNWRTSAFPNMMILSLICSTSRRQLRQQSKERLKMIMSPRDTSHSPVTKVTLSSWLLRWAATATNTHSRNFIITIQPPNNIHLTPLSKSHRAPSSRAEPFWLPCNNFHPKSQLVLLLQSERMKIVIALLLVSLVAADSCGGNCPAGNCPRCYCGTGRNPLDVATWCAKYSWNQNCCKCILSHGSEGNAHALAYNPNGSTDVGLWQINNVDWTACSGGSAPCDPTTNLNCAIVVYKNAGNSWKQWSAHTACGC